MPPDRTGPLLVLAAAALWGTTGTAQALGPEGITPETVAVIRMAGGSTLVAYAVMRRNTVPVRSLPPVALAVAIAAMAASQPLFFAGVERTGVAIGTVLTIGSGPIIAGLMARVVRGEPLSRRWVVATVVAVAGVLLLVTGGEAAGVDPVGVGFALASGIAWPTYLLAAKALFDDAPPVFVVGVVFTGAAIVLSPFLVVSDPSWVASGRGLAVAAWLALVATALSYIAFSVGLRRTPVAATATFTLAEPVTASVLGVTVLDEPLLVGTALGIALVVVGLLVLSTERAPVPPGP